MSLYRGIRTLKRIMEGAKKAHIVKGYIPMNGHMRPCGPSTLFFLAGTTSDRMRLVYLEELGGISIPMPFFYYV
jgi:hypothetical protein